MTGTTTRPRPELVETISELAREYAEHERRKAAMIQEALDDEAGDHGRPAEDVFDEVEALLEERIRATWKDRVGTLANARLRYAA